MANPTTNFPVLEDGGGGGSGSSSGGGSSSSASGTGIRYDSNGWTPPSVSVDNSKGYTIFNQMPTLIFSYDSRESGTSSTVNQFYYWYSSVSEYSWVDDRYPSYGLKERPKQAGTIELRCPSNTDFNASNLGVTVSVRGNYTARYPKKPLKLKFSEKVNLLGLNKGKASKKWTLLAEYNDQTMLNNATALFIARRICKDQWAPDGTFVHVYVKDITDAVNPNTGKSLNEGMKYLGVYFLTSQRDAGESSVNIDDSDYKFTEDIGFLFELDDYCWKEYALNVCTPGTGDPYIVLRNNTNRNDWLPTNQESPSSLEESVKWSYFAGNGWPSNTDIKSLARTAYRVANNDSTIATNPLRYQGYTVKSNIDKDDTGMPSDLGKAQLSRLKVRLKKIYYVLSKICYSGELYALDDSAPDSTGNGSNWAPVSAWTGEQSPEACARAVIDVDSFVNSYILNEICCDPDLGHSSFNFSLDLSKTGDGLLKATCPWDFDLALGCTDWNGAFAMNAINAGLWARKCWGNPFLYLLVSPNAGHNGWFMDLVKKRWRQLRNAGLFGAVSEMRESYANCYAQDFARNFHNYEIDQTSHYPVAPLMVVANGKYGEPDYGEPDGSDLAAWDLWWYNDIGQDTPKNFIKSEYYNFTYAWVGQKYIGRPAQSEIFLASNAWLTGRGAALDSQFEYSEGERHEE